MFQFPKYCLLRTMNSSGDRRLLTAGLPHSEISGSQLVYSSPKLIAVSHVLLRLLMPRHPPFALSSLALFNKYYQLKTLCPKCFSTQAFAQMPHILPKMPHTLLILYNRSVYNEILNLSQSISIVTQYSFFKERAETARSSDAVASFPHPLRWSPWQETRLGRDNRS